MWRLKIGEGNGDDPYLFTTNNFAGRQTWEFDPDAGSSEERYSVVEARRSFYDNRFRVKASSDLLWRMQFLKEKKYEQLIPPVKVEGCERITFETATNALRRGVHFFSALQASDGHWPAENAGPLFFLPPLVFCLYITGHLGEILTSEHRKEVLRYIYCHQREDGGWGLHIEGHSTVFCTVLNYTCMRILGEPPDGGHENACRRARKWIHLHGGVTFIPSWGKIWLSILGVFDWSGSNPMPPEFWILPSFLPMHPAKMWCYCRMVYLPMSYLYGKRFVGPITPLILQLRKELYLQPYEEITWNKVRHLCAKEDAYSHRPLVQELIWDSLYIFAEPILARWPFNKLLRQKALQVAMKHIHYEDENSRYITIGCVEKVLCMLACWVEDPNGDYFKKHLARISDYLWVAEDGMKMQSFGSQLWDTAFAMQALFASNLSNEISDVLRRGHGFIKNSQVRENPSGDFKSMYRHISKGAWTFSDRDHGWQVSDCTADGLKDDVEAEMKRLRLELKQTMDMYSTACKEALSARQQASELQKLRTEEERRLEEAKSSEEAAMSIVEKERAKAKAALEAADAAKRLAEVEAKRRLTAEMKALKESDSFSRGFVRYRKYTVEEIEEATSNFAESQKVGEGGYGPVFRGFLDHTSVAVKVLRPDAAQGRSQFQKEVEVLSCIRHPNMVLLLGACPEFGILVYEYMAKGSLEDRLFMRGNTPPITWQLRFRIAAEIATGLLFLHQTKPEPIVHRDLKPGNVLLDYNYVSKISDVGLARLVPAVAENVTQYRVTSAAGTFCYIDPEYQQTGMLGVKSDVYSLGIMLLQILTAKQPMGLAYYVEQAVEEGTLKDMLDPAVPDWPMEEALALAKLSLQCAELRRKDRPDLGKEILPELNRLRNIGEESLESVFYAGSQGRSPNTSQVSISSSSDPFISNPESPAAESNS